VTGKLTSTNARSHSLRPDRSAVVHLRVGRPPRPHQGHANKRVRAFGGTSGAELVDYDGPRDSTQDHKTPAPRRSERRRIRSPFGHIRIGSRIPSSAPPLRAVESFGTTKSAKWELTGGSSTMIAARNPTVRSASRAGPSVPGCRRRDDPTNPLPRLAAAKGSITAHGNDIPGENRELLEAPTAPAATAERRSKRRQCGCLPDAAMDLRGAKADAVSFWQMMEDPRASIAVPASIDAGIGGAELARVVLRMAVASAIGRAAGCVTSRHRATQPPIRRRSAKSSAAQVDRFPVGVGICAGRMSPPGAWLRRGSDAMSFDPSARDRRSRSSVGACPGPPPRRRRSSRFQAQPDARGDGQSARLERIQPDRK
jgi:hypothetical protein